MKKLLMLLSGVLVTSAAYASPVLNPAAPALNTDGLFYCCPDSCWALRAGFRGDYVFNRKLEDAAHTIDRYSLYSNEAVLTLNLWEKVDIYGLVGATSQDWNSKWTDRPSIAAPTVRYESVTYATETIWGAGLKIVLLEWDWTCHCGRSFISAAVDYEAVNSANCTTGTDNGVVFNQAVIPHTSYQETQVSLAWGHRVKNLVPYIGVKWSNARSNMTRTSFTTARSPAPLVFQDMKSRQHWGWVVGTSLVDVGRMTVSAEARFIDETAMTVTGSFRF